MDRATICNRIEEALAADHDEATRHDIAFHMTDWLNELRALIRIYDGPATAEEIRSALMDFLVHAPAHVAAAAKLHTGAPVTDVFGVGAV